LTYIITKGERLTVELKPDRRTISLHCQMDYEIALVEEKK